MITVRAIYEKGLLRPAHPLPLAEGETVEITVANAPPGAPPISADEITRRLQTATTLEEWLAATKLLPADDGGYDIGEALQKNRRWSGEVPRPLSGGDAS